MDLSYDYSVDGIDFFEGMDGQSLKDLHNTCVMEGNVWYGSFTVTKIRL